MERLLSGPRSGGKVGYDVFEVARQVWKRVAWHVLRSEGRCLRKEVWREWLDDEGLLGEGLT